MRHYNAHHNEDGFSVLELVIIMLFLGIISAISAPSFLALNQKNQVNQDLTNAKNALLEAQRGAMRRGQSCTLSLSTGTPPTISSTSGNCLSQGTRTLNNVSMTISTSKTSAPSATNTNYYFDYRGVVVDGSGSSPNDVTEPTTIVLKHRSNTGDQKCIVVSSPLGLIATGKYKGTSTADYSSNCQP
jgi:type II secretory pathway pseudopilin PulG